MIISASRRTDIPSFYGKWFVNRLKEGYLLIQNPYNENRYSHASLKREAVDLIVFWTKNPIPFLPYLSEIESMGYPYAFHFTLTPYGKEIETGLPPKEDLISTFIHLSQKIGKNRMVWRYDPILIDEKHSISFHKEQFAAMAKKIAPFADRVVVSFVDNYKNVTRRMGHDPTYSISDKNIHQIAKLFSEIARSENISLFTCAEEIDLSAYGILHGACIDKGWVEKILARSITCNQDKNQRVECRCIESIDIGTYNCCANGCAYCYALQSEAASHQNMRKHNLLSPLLIGEINSNAIITYRPTKSVINEQLELF